MNDITTADHRQAAAVIRDLLGAHREAADLLKIGAYVPGSDARVDAAVRLMPQIEALVRQTVDEPGDRQSAIQGLTNIARAA